MKKLLAILGFFITVNTFAQKGDDIVDALKTGNTEKFTSYFSNNVDVKLPQKTEMKNVNRADAASTISNFFSANNINGFEVTSQREMSGTMYIAGKLTGSGQSYNLTVMLKTSNDKMTVITVRIS